MRNSKLILLKTFMRQKNIVIYICNKTSKVNHLEKFSILYIYYNDQNIHPYSWCLIFIAGS